MAIHIDLFLPAKAWKIRSPRTRSHKSCRLFPFLWTEFCVIPGGLLPSPPAEAFLSLPPSGFLQHLRPIQISRTSYTHNPMLLTGTGTSSPTASCPEATPIISRMGLLSAPGCLSRPVWRYPC